MRHSTLAVRLALGAVLALGCSSAPASRPPPASAPASDASPLLSRPVPDFSRTALDGRRVDTARLRGRVVVVKFFAKFCEPCKRTLPVLQELARRRPDVAILGISEDERESDAHEVVRSFGLSFPVVHDREQILAGRYRVQELPVTFVIDAGGRVRWVGGPFQREADAVLAVESSSTN